MVFLRPVRPLALGIVAALAVAGPAWVTGCGVDDQSVEVLDAALEPMIIDSAAAEDPDTTNRDSAPPDSAPAGEPGSEASDPQADGEEGAPGSDAPSADAAPSPIATTAPLRPDRPPAPNGQIAPRPARGADELADQLIEATAGLADPAASTDQLAHWGHLHQVAIRKLGYAAEWEDQVMAALAPDVAEQVGLHLAARRAFMNMHRGYGEIEFIPAWEIIDPEPEADLLAAYRQAESATGIEWEYLAAINLVETGMGRIRGLSTAGAQGPMQFLPTTWAEAGIGEGDINDPGDAIAAAARYLVRRGGPADMDAALWGYNNSDDYVAGVSAYAELLRRYPGAYRQIHNWEIYFAADDGDIWLPVGFVSDEAIRITDFVAANPWSAPDPELAMPQPG